MRGVTGSVASCSFYPYIRGCQKVKGKIGRSSKNVQRGKEKIVCERPKDDKGGGLLINKRSKEGSRWFFSFTADLLGVEGGRNSNKRFQDVEKGS